MAVQRLENFTGGIQTRVPPYRIGNTEVVDALDVDFSHTDIRPDKAVGGTGGGNGYFYEAGDVWISAGGTGGQVYSRFTVTSDTTLNAADSSSPANDVTNSITRYTYNVANPVTVELNATLTVGAGTGGGTATNPAHNGVALVVNNLEQGIGKADSYVEYNDDLYIGRSKFEVNIPSSGTLPSIANSGAGGVAQVTVPLDDVVNCVVGDSVEAEGIPFDTRITAINSGTGVLTLDKAATSTGNNKKVTVNTVPIRIIDGDTENLFKVGIDKPVPSFTITQLSADNASRETASHSSKWYVQDYPIPFQYGISYFDEKTLAESPISELSDRDISQSIISTTNNSSPILVDFNVAKAGKYAIYRVGGTSSVLKKVCNYYDTGSTDVSVAVSVNHGGTNGQIRITPSNLPSGAYFRLKWLAYGSKKYHTANSATDATTTGTTTYTTTPGDIDLYGFNTNNSAAASHYVDIICQISFLDDSDPVDSRDYMVQGINISATTVSKAEIIDFTKPRALIDIQPFEDSGPPPVNGKFIKEVNNFFFLAVDKRLHISSFGSPNSWPLDGFVDFDSQITGLSDRGSELLVFTDAGLFRCYGNAANEFRKVRVSTKEGVEPGMDKCISKISGGTIYTSPDGICFYNGESVDNLTKPKLDSFYYPSSDAVKNLGGVIDDQYYLLSDTNNGWKLDFRFGAQKISRTTTNATNLHYRGKTNLLYTESGYIAGGSENLYTVKTRDFDGGDVTREKVFSKILVKGANFNGTINVYINSILEDTFPVLTTISELNRAFYISSARMAGFLSVEFENCTGKINDIGVFYEFAESYKETRFNSVEIVYIGSPTVSFKVDSVVKISNVVLPDPGPDNTGTTTLTFPSMTEGSIPHLITSETETSKVISHTYDAEVI